MLLLNQIQKYDKEDNANGICLDNAFKLIFSSGSTLWSVQIEKIV